MEIVSAFNAYKNKGKVTTKDSAYGSSYYQPLQFLPDAEKDDAWCVQFINWAEYEGLIQIRERALWMMKNYKMAIGVIERADYIREDNAEYPDMIEALEKQGGKTLEAMQLKSFNLGKTVVNVIVDEFTKRTSHMAFDDKSPSSQNEMLDEKKEEIGKFLEMQAAIKQQARMIELGLAEDSPEAQQMMAPETIKSLPEIQQFYTKSYRNIYQEWAQHQMDVDNDRFAMPELERMQFRNMLITDREFWHFRMMENDYEIEAWNPPQVFYRKSPGSPYMSNASRIGYVEYMTIPDIVDMDGYKMTEEQLLSLNTIHGARATAYGLDGVQADGFWDENQSWNWNRTGPGIAMRQATSVLGAIGANVGGYGDDVIRQIVNQSEDTYNVQGDLMVRRTTVYWKTQRKYYHLTKIDQDGNQISDIVGENYKVTTKPMYNTVLYKEKTKENLVYGEHLDPLWANEVWGGIRIGTNVPSIAWQGTSAAFAPIYLGINGGKPGRLPFQFKGDKSIYGCKLPVEGCVFTDHNTKSRAMLDNIKPWDIGYNMAMNMLQDTMVNDLGVIVQLDPNALPKHTLTEDWGPDNLQSSVAVMRDLQILPAFSAGKNADGDHIGANPIQKLDLSQTERLLGLAKIADFFKMGGLDSVGLNPQRVGTPIDREETATGINQAVAAGYSHTEYLFTQHSDNLMPRVHQMRTDLAQYYNSTNPSLRLQYTTDAGEKAFFEIDGTKLLGKDFNVRCTTRVNARAMLLQIKQLLLTNNTSGANLYDLVRGMQIPTVTEMNTFMKGLEQRTIQEQQQKMGQEQQMHDQELQQQLQLLQQKQQFEMEKQDKEIQKDIYVAEIQAESRAVQTNSPADSEAAYQKGLDRIEAQQNFQETMNLDRQKHLTDTALKEKTLAVQQAKVKAEENRTKQELQSAKIQAKVKEKSEKNKK